jgi:hypothetical protein
MPCHSIMPPCLLRPYTLQPHEDQTKALGSAPHPSHRQPSDSITFGPLSTAVISRGGMAVTMPHDALHCGDIRPCTQQIAGKRAAHIVRAKMLDRMGRRLETGRLLAQIIGHR